MRKLFTATFFSLVLGIGSAYAADIVVQIRPPRAVVEHRTPAPSRDHVWVPGYHRWEGNAYVWTPGRWEIPPHRHAKWIAPRWDHRGKGWVFVEGRWK